MIHLKNGVYGGGFLRDDAPPSGTRFGVVSAYPGKGSLIEVYIMRANGIAEVEDPNMEITMAVPASKVEWTA